MGCSAYAIRIMLGFGAVLLGVEAYSSGTACAEEGSMVAVEPLRLELAETRVAFEVARFHVRQWESNEAARTLVTQMLDDLTPSGDSSTVWHGSFLSVAEGRIGEQPDDFEKAAIRQLSTGAGRIKHVWSPDKRRIVSSVPARKSCVNCHDAVVGEIISYVSLRPEMVDK